MAFGGENAESYYDEGLTASMKGDLVLAVQHFERAIQLDNSLSAAYHQLGRCYHRLGQPQKAVELLEQVVRARPKQVPPRVDLAAALLELGRVEQARLLFNEVTQAKPDNVRAQLGIAQCALAEGQPEVAMQLAESTVRLGGSGFAALFLLGRAAMAAGNAVLAEEALGQADTLLSKNIESKPEQPEGYYLRGEVHVGRKKIAEALEFYRAAEERAQGGVFYAAFGERFTRVDIQFKQALCLKELGRIDAARDLAEKILREHPGHPVQSLLTDGAS